MIKSIELKNIQSHESTKLEFSNGINCIVGSSNNGKSAILRGLYWVRYNRPLGIDTLASHWVLNEKGELVDEMSVTVENDNGVVERKRTKDKNQYVVNGKDLNVVKCDVPDVVEMTLRLSDTNIQRQMDAPFLLSSTSGEVAKYFNKVVRLDIIDKVLSNAESKRRKAKNEIENVENQINECESKLESFAWLDSVDKLLNKYERVEKRNADLKEKCGVLGQQVERYFQMKGIISKCDFSKQKKIIADIEFERQKNEQLNNCCWVLSNAIGRFESVKVYPDFSKQKKIIEKLLAYNPDTDKIKKLTNDCYLYGVQKMHIENRKKDIDCLKEQLPAICPCCNRPIEMDEWKILSF